VRHLVPGVLLLLCGVVALFAPSGRTATPTWLFCLGVGLLSLYQGLILMRMTRQPKAVEPLESPPSVEPATPDEREEVVPPSQTLRKPTDDELLAGIGVQMDHTPPRESS